MSALLSRASGFLGLRFVAAAMVLALLPFVALPLLAMPFGSSADHHHARSRDGLGSLAKAMLARSTERMQGYPPYRGRAFVLSLVVDGYLDPSDGSAVDFLFSPHDPVRLERPSLAEYRALTRARLAAGGDFRRYTSFVGPGERDPASESRGGVPMLADLHTDLHGAVVAFWDGRVDFLSRAELGLGPDDPMVVGPTSRSSILRQLAE